MIQTILAFVGGAVLSALSMVSLFSVRLAVLRRDCNAMAGDGRRDSARITRIEHTLSRLDADFEPYDTPT
jgi:hypothetical protein